MKNWVSITLKTAISAVILFVIYWFMLPPLNPQSVDFWVFIGIGFGVVWAINSILAIFSFLKPRHYYERRYPAFKSDFKALSLTSKICLTGILSVVVIVVVCAFFGSQVFNAKKYNRLLFMTDGDFSADVAEISREQIPVVDRDTAERLGQRKLGEMADLVSQFEIADNYTQINYQGRPVRVTPLDYGDAIKWLNNKKEGVPAYIMVDMTTQETTLVRLKSGMKYSEGEYFMRNIKRYLRFKYPTKIFDDISFEIDDNGTPYYVASTVKHKIGLFGGKDINGAVLVNAVNGECKYYSLKDVPTWVDKVYSSELIIKQLKFNGKYRSGYFNSIFGQKGVLQPTEGYNYLAINDDVYLYTGITSVTSDESNIGFVLCNMRTKETKFYTIPGAEEYSAMSSAEGQVQHLNYTATFPLLLNVSDRPSYFMSLKDSAGLVKMYAFVDVQQYQIVGTGNTVSEAQADYLNKLSNENINAPIEQNQTVEGVIYKTESVVIDGNTVYLVMLENSNEIYKVSVKLLPELSFKNSGENIKLTVNSKGEAISAEFLEITNEQE